MKTIGFDINPGFDCNFHCKYCVGHSGSVFNDGMQPETMARFHEFLEYLKTKHDTIAHLMFFGGEPLLYYKQVRDIIRQNASFAGSFTIITNGSLVSRRDGEIIRMAETARRLSRGKSLFKVSVSYDYAFQNQNRKDGSYGDVREAIIFLAKHGLLKKTITTIDKETLPFIDLIFSDYMALKRQIPQLLATFNLDLSGDLSNFPMEQTRKALLKIQRVMFGNQVYRSFVHNVPRGMSRQQPPHVIVSYCLEPDGSITSGCFSGFRVKQISDIQHNPLVNVPDMMGSVFDDFDSLVQKQKHYLELLDKTLPKKCRECKAVCKIHSLQGMISGDGTWNGLPSEEYCQLINLIHNTIGVFHDGN